jgi:hypothetical protein
MSPRVRDRARDADEALTLAGGPEYSRDARKKPEAEGFAEDALV